MQPSLSLPSLASRLLGTAVASAMLWLAPGTMHAAPAWQVQNTPNPGPAFNEFNGIVAISSTNAFAVGSFSAGSEGTNGIPLIERFNGSSWNVNATPALPRRFCTETTSLNAAASAGGEVWAVGACSFSGRKLIEHLGSTAWEIVSAPDPACFFSEMLNGVAAISTSDVWAVGFYQNCQRQNLPLTMHWNGSAWTVVSAPSPSGSGNPAIRAVAGSGRNDVWMVGFVNPGNSPIIEHWNGASWSPVTSPRAGVQLYGVTAISPTDAWAVGTDMSCSNCQTPLIEHWDGRAWTVVSAPSVNAPNLTAIAAVSSTNVWAVGYTGNVDNPDTIRTLTLHWDGSAWNIVPSPSPDASAQLFGVGVLPDGNVWAVGASANPAPNHDVKTLVIHLAQ